MKRIILSLIVVAFAVAAQAADTKATQDKDKSGCCASKIKACDQAKDGTCPFTKSACSKQKEAKAAPAKQAALASPKTAK